MNDDKRTFASMNATLTLVVILVIIGLSWRSCWYATPLSDGQMESRLQGKGSESEIQKALSQLKDRIEAGDDDVDRFYDGLVGLAGHETAQIRSTVAWVMGAARKHELFEAPLLELLADPVVQVRYNAAVSLGSRGVGAARAVLKDMLDVYRLRSPIAGTVREPRSPGESLRAGKIVARVETPNGDRRDLLSPLDGRLSKLVVKHGEEVGVDATVAEIEPSQGGQIENALIALAGVATIDDLPAVQRIVEGHLQVSEGTRRMAVDLARAIRERAKKD